MLCETTNSICLHSAFPCARSRNELEDSLNSPLWILPMSQNTVGDTKGFSGLSRSETYQAASGCRRVLSLLANISCSRRFLETPLGYSLGRVSAFISACRAHRKQLACTLSLSLKLHYERALSDLPYAPVLGGKKAGVSFEFVRAFKMKPSCVVPNSARPRRKVRLRPDGLGPDRLAHLKRL